MVKTPRHLQVRQLFFAGVRNQKTDDMEKLERTFKVGRGRQSRRRRVAGRVNQPKE